MTGKKSKSSKHTSSFETQQKRRARTLQILLAVFSMILILSMVLAAMSK